MHVLNTQFEPQLFGSHPRARADAFRLLHEAMAAAHTFGAGHYTFHGITRLKKNSAPADPARLAPAFRDIIDACAEHGVRLCLETVHWALYNAPGLFRPLAAACPDLMGVLDVKQARLSATRTKCTSRTWRGTSRTSTSPTSTSAAASACPGRGIFDFEECLRRLKDAGFDGAAIIEVYPDNYKEYAELKRACDYIDELIYKIG